MCHTFITLIVLTTYFLDTKLNIIKKYLGRIKSFAQLDIYKKISIHLFTFEGKWKQISISKVKAILPLPPLRFFVSMSFKKTYD
jgi:hypothetical protein